jgi:hypothetical protein
VFSTVAEAEKWLVDEGRGGADPRCSGRGQAATLSFTVIASSGEGWNAN